MPNTVTFITYNLKKEASIPDFLLAADELQREFNAKKKTHLSSMLLSNPKMWADLIYWETFEDTLKSEEECSANPASGKYFSFMGGEDDQSLDLHPHFKVEKNYSENENYTTPKVIEFTYLGIHLTEVTMSSYLCGAVDMAP